VCTCTYVDMLVFGARFEVSVGMIQIECVCEYILNVNVLCLHMRVIVRAMTKVIKIGRSSERERVCR